MSRKPETARYIYRPRYNTWVIYRITQEGAGPSETKVKECGDEEEARKEVYRLNGWHYQSKKTKS